MLLVLGLVNDDPKDWKALITPLLHVTYAMTFLSSQENPKSILKQNQATVGLVFLNLFNVDQMNPRFGVMCVHKC